MNPLSRSQQSAERILAVVDSVPPGSVATYGQIASEAGLPRRARLVGKVLGSLEAGSSIPWHRIVNASGEISPRGNPEAARAQRERLVAEGVQFRPSGKIDLARHGWSPQ